MFDTIAPRYDLVNKVMTFGVDVVWRHQAVRALSVPPGSLVLDLACGTGDFCRELENSGVRPVGADSSLGMLTHARTVSPLLQGDALALPIRDGYLDGAISGFALRNFVALEPVFAELARVLRPGGRLALLDVSVPRNAAVRVTHGFYFNKVVPKVGAALSDRDAYGYLPRSVAYLPPSGRIAEMLADAGFGALRHRLLTGGVAQLFTATRKVLAG
jgi:demethylmenaquinone methyltransferase/2-methoxy-6-polyprenyl-1,4-benzoquinol methylase